MEQKQYRSIHEIPLTLGRVFEIGWGESQYTAGYVVGREIGDTHVYMSMNLNHDKEACCGMADDNRRKMLGIEKIAVDLINTIRPLDSNVVFVPQRKESTCHSPVHEIAKI